MELLKKGVFVFSILLCVIVIFFMYTRPIGDGDTWWHMSYGKYLLENKTLIPDHTIYTWTKATNDIIYCAWLPEICFYKLYQWGGVNALYALRYIIPLLSLFLFVWAAIKTGVAFHPLSGLTGLVSLLIAGIGATLIKPEIISFLFMFITVFLWWFIRVEGKKYYKAVYLFPVIMLLWVNTHGAFIFGFPFLGLVLLGDIINSRFNPTEALEAEVRKHLLIAFILSGIALFITPYGWKYPVQLFQMTFQYDAVSGDFERISAYSATFGITNPTLYIIISLLVTLYAFIAVKKTKKYDFAIILTNLFYIALYLKFLRTTFFWAPVFAFNTLYMLADDALIAKIKRKAVVWVYIIIVVLISLDQVRWTVYNALFTPPREQWLGLGNGYINSMDETEFIKQNYSAYKIGNVYNNGGYMLWRLGPDVKIMIDPRYFPFKDMYREFLDFDSGKSIESFVKKYPFDVINLQYMNQVLITYFYESADWKLAYYGPSGPVFVKKEVPLPQNSIVRGSSLGNIKNLHSAAEACAFALSIRDWEGVQIIFTSMSRRFGLADQVEVVQKMGDYIKGVVAYYNRDYSNAIGIFENVSDTVFVDKYLLISMYYHKAVESWTGNIDRKALEYVNKALEKESDDLYGAYNYGIINYWIWKNTETEPGTGASLPGSIFNAGNSVFSPAPLSEMKTGDVNSIKNTKWYKALEFFMEKTEGVRSAAGARMIVQGVLKGTYTGKPPLIYPPEPAVIGDPFKKLSEK
ncbi:MAG: hypothetical protein CVV44_15160 [Spirochaetae bacterium HGW-Spirochaetae-1]|jgi:hypothetical protein|nr:MAG: hypothetical protein CVV44_15160 [Spirochaetae bacterium HGW-Spirochaetae-1]